jgi:hypothetical protein
MPIILPPGILPTPEQFYRAVSQVHQPHHPLRFRKDPRVGDCDLSESELLREIRLAHREATPSSLAWVAKQLSYFNIHWIKQ